MNRSLYQHNDQSWVAQVALYIVVAALILAVFTYAVLLVKSQRLASQVASLDQKILAFGTAPQKMGEKSLLEKKKKIDDFAKIIVNHKISSNVFGFLEASTLPGVVFSGFEVSQASNEMHLSGEADNMSTLGMQFSIFENADRYVESISVLDSQTLSSSKVSFVFNISLNPGIFNYGTDFSVNPPGVLPN